MKKVLIVDDEPEIVEILVDELARNGFASASAGNGREAFQVVIQGDIDAVFSDVRMPGGDGIELLARIRQKGLTMPFAFMSAFADLSLQGAASLGAQTVFQKPYDLEEVVAFLRRELESK
jgi:two-component system nitrogen regulation response regulator GlnG